jgi:tetratricopeptide (TPR) repeat protein
MPQRESYLDQYGPIPMLVICLLLILGLGFAGIQAEAGRVFLLLLWSMAWLGLGSLLGFLFGVPRVLQGTLPASPPPAPPSTGTASATAPAPATPAPSAVTASQYLQRVNTNLEQISDWLTKILLGVGLVQFKELPGLVQSAAGYMASGMATLDAAGQPPRSAQTLAAAVIVYFSVLGFVGSYLVMRLYVSRLLYWADQPELLERERRAIDVGQVEPIPAERQVSGLTLQAAQQYALKPFKEISSEQDVRLWARAQLLTGKANKALEGYRQSVQLTPEEPKVWYEYAVALYEAGKRADAQEKLREALRRLSVVDRPSRSLKERIYKALTYYSLYDPPPDGFTDAIRYGEEYTQDPQNPPSGAILVNVLCGYGQKCRWLDAQKGDPQERASAHAQALELVRQILAIENGRWRDRLLELMVKERRTDPEDNDLEVFEKDPEFRKLLGLPT